jgi:hypothetical protein
MKRSTATQYRWAVLEGIIKIVVLRCEDHAALTILRLAVLGTAVYGVNVLCSVKSLGRAS